jgi:hypothetical protein
MTLRDYTDLMNMHPQELTKYALECAKLGVLSVSLTEALAHQLETEAGYFDRTELLREELERAETRIADLEIEMFDLRRQLERSFT